MSDTTPRAGDMADCECGEPIIWAGRRWHHRNPYRVKTVHWPKPAAIPEHREKETP